MKTVRLVTGWDVPFLAFLLVLGLAGGRLAATSSGPAEGLWLRTTAGRRSLPLRPGAFEAEGPLGVSRLRVTTGLGVEFLSSPCPAQVCRRLGRIHDAGRALVCVPNRVLVELTGESGSGGLDGVTQ